MRATSVRAASATIVRVTRTVAPALVRQVPSGSWVTSPGSVFVDPVETKRWSGRPASGVGGVAQAEPLVEPPRPVLGHHQLLIAAGDYLVHRHKVKARSVVRPSKVEADR